MLRKTPLRAKPPAPVKRERAPLVLVPRAEPSRAVMALVLPKPATKPVLKTPDRKSQAIRDSANGEECCVRIPGICSGDATHTIWSHAPFGAAGKGRSVKSLDVAGAYACVECDQCVDGQRKAPAGYSREQVLLDWFFGHMRSLVRLKQKGLV
ncbi:nuclease domain-containing protein [Methylibium petroleiphilum]